MSKSRSTVSRRKRWSARVTQKSDALDLEKGVFSGDDPSAIAGSLMKSAKRSTRRKSSPRASAMSMLNFYINRAGRKLSKTRRRILERAKARLRQLGKADTHA